MIAAVVAPSPPLGRVCVCMDADVIKLQLVEAGLVECLLDVVAQTVDGDREEDVSQLKTASDLMVLLLLGGKSSRPPVRGPPPFLIFCFFR